MWKLLFNRQRLNGITKQSDLMRRATDLAMLDRRRTSKPLSKESRGLFHTLAGSLGVGTYFSARANEGWDHIDQMQQQAGIDSLHDPYITPGNDMNIDAHYHGIDNGADCHHHDSGFSDSAHSDF